MLCNPSIASVVARVAAHFSVPLFGLPNSSQAHAATQNPGVPFFVPELYVDINYSDEEPHVLLPVGKGRAPVADEIPGKIESCARHNQSCARSFSSPLGTWLMGLFLYKALSVSGKTITLPFGGPGTPFSVCIHSDFPAAIENVKAYVHFIQPTNYSFTLNATFFFP
jgi:hypothetical protein